MLVSQSVVFWLWKSHQQIRHVGSRDFPPHTSVEDNLARPDFETQSVRQLSCLPLMGIFALGFTGFRDLQNHLCMYRSHPQPLRFAALALRFAPCRPSQQWSFR